MVINVVSIRPVTIRKVVSVIKALKDLDCAEAEMIAERLNITTEYSEEVLRFLEELGLISRSADCYSVTESGIEFAKAVEDGDSAFLDGVLSKIPEYVMVATCVEKGYRRPRDISMCAGINVFRADILFRLYKEVHGLGVANTANIDQDIFNKTFFEVYIELSRLRRSRYVRLAELLATISSRLGINIDHASRMLENTLKKHRSRILLTRAPALSDAKPVKLYGKSYTHVAVF